MRLSGVSGIDKIGSLPCTEHGFSQQLRTHLSCLRRHHEGQMKMRSRRYLLFPSSLVSQARGLRRGSNPRRPDWMGSARPINPGPIDDVRRFFFASRAPPTYIRMIV